MKKTYNIPAKARQELLRIQNSVYGISQERAKAISSIADSFVLIGKANQQLDALYQEWANRMKRVYVDAGISKVQMAALKEKDISQINLDLGVSGVDVNKGEIYVGEEDSGESISSKQNTEQETEVPSA